ncbi:MAG: diacylglycerol kinase family protein [Pseudomonadota bacterium]
MSFRFAASGLVYVLRTQTNAQIHTFAATLAIGAGFQFSFEPWAWALLALAIAFVLFAEVMNTAIEYLCDVVCPERSKAVQRAKDIAAGAVLISATCAVSVGLIVLHATSAAELVSPGDLCLYE